MTVPYASLTSKDKIYTYVSPDGSRVFSVHVNGIEKSIQARLVPSEMIPLKHKSAVAMIEAGVVNMLKVRELARLPVLSIKDPILMIAHPDGSSTIIEGAELYCAALWKGRTELLARRVPLSVWSQFLVTGIPYTDDQLRVMSTRKPTLMN